MLYIFEKVLNRQIFWYQNVDWLYRKPRQNNFANTVGIKCLSNHTPHRPSAGAKRRVAIGHPNLLVAKITKIAATLSIVVKSSRREFLGSLGAFIKNY